MCVLWLSVCACVSVHVCGVCCHHLGCVVVDSRLHTPGKSVITQAKAHTHCELVHSVVALPPPFPLPPPPFSCSLSLSFVLSLCLSPKLFLCDSSLWSHLWFGYDICLLCFGMCRCFWLLHPYALATCFIGNPHTRTHMHRGIRNVWAPAADLTQPASQPITQDSV